jgi:hypothetical protein
VGYLDRETILFQNQNQEFFQSALSGVHARQIRNSTRGH